VPLFSEDGKVLERTYRQAHVFFSSELRQICN
jgi:hypothetical protein